MARRLLIASLVGASGASGLTSASDLELVQISRTTLKTSRDELGRDFFTHAGVPIYPRMVDDEREAKAEKVWMFMLKKDATDAELEALLQELHPTSMKTNPGKGELPFVEGRLTDDELATLLENHPGLVTNVEQDELEPRITEHIDKEEHLERRTYPWGIQDINADVVRGRGAGVHVYVLDTGIRTTHVSFGGRAFAGVDVAATGTLTVCTPSSTTCAADNHFHGTHCAGTVGASTYGVADGATLWAMKVLDDTGYGYTSWSIAAEQWVLSSGSRPAVVSMSLGGAGNFVSEATSIPPWAVDMLVDDGITVVVAAGNQNDDACGYNPAYVPSAITVASYASGGAKSSFSNYGSCVDVWAPGSDILSTHFTSDVALAYASGTSMACPHVSGLAAIMYEAHPTAGSMTAAQRWALLTAVNRTDYVTGIPTTPATVNLVALAPTPTPSPTPSPMASPTPNPTTSPTPTRRRARRRTRRPARRRARRPAQRQARRPTQRDQGLCRRLATRTWSTCMDSASTSTDPASTSSSTSRGARRRAPRGCTLRRTPSSWAPRARSYTSGQ
ncbi:unnamed protein product [Prorocentrum cordatum]|uniref:subtilisin n=1 Tax=Prorocentrum cordatum TaxID=2364126 RepID=A0ABN9WPU8_9DINO|nr:unnamed protein product [Polarella glacialis]